MEPVGEIQRVPLQKHIFVAAPVISRAAETVLPPRRRASTETYHANEKVRHNRDSFPEKVEVMMVVKVGVVVVVERSGCDDVSLLLE